MKKKTVAILMVCVLLLGGVIGGTLAWLTAETDPVENTFTVGDINITLAETTGTNFKIIPGGTAAKDPSVTVISGSEKCYVYVSVTNNVKLDGTIVATPNIATADWTQIGTNENTIVYRYKEVVDASAADVKLPVFTSVSYSDSITKSNITDLTNKTIVVDSFAHQSDNITEVSVADKAAFEHFGISA